MTILAVSAATVTSGFSQGAIQFQNSGTTRVSVNSSIGGTSFATLPNTANSYYFALFYSATATTVDGGTSAVVGEAGDTAANFVLGDSGWTFAGGTTPAIAASQQASKGGTFASLVADSNNNTYVNGVGAGGTANFVVIGWSANIGSTEQSLVNFFNNNDGGVTTGWVGQSTLSGPITLGSGGLSLTPSLFGSPGIGSGFSLGELQIVPEPSSIALGVMGAASLLALRRKKA